ncbi:hypothetical protein FGG08_007701, partial [Glutinoglossum americanum]
DVWKMFTIITRERKRREIQPALAVLGHCAESTRDLTSPEGRAFYEQMRKLEEFVGFASKIADQVATMKHAFALQIAAKLLS